MNKFLKSASALVIAFLSLCALAQETAKLPSFKTFYTFTHINYRNDISFTPVEGQMKGRLVFVGDRCFIDQEVLVRDDAEAFVIVVPTMTARVPQDEDFCKRESVITLPKKKGAFGYRGTFNASGANRPPNSGYFPY